MTYDLIVTLFVGAAASSVMLLILFILLVSFGVSEAIEWSKKTTEVLAETAFGVLSWVT